MDLWVLVCSSEALSEFGYVTYPTADHEGLYIPDCLWFWLQRHEKKAKVVRKVWPDRNPINNKAIKSPRIWSGDLWCSQVTGFSFSLIPVAFELGFWCPGVCNGLWSHSTLCSANSEWNIKNNEPTNTKATSKLPSCSGCLWWGWRDPKAGEKAIGMKRGLCVSQVAPTSTWQNRTPRPLSRWFLMPRWF